MSQHDMNIANQTGAPFRADLNTAFEAVATQQSGATAPSTTYPFQHWIDTAGGTPLLKIRNAANNAWQTVRAMATTFEAFYTNNLERVRILNDGRVAIGKTTADYLLDVNGEINGTGLRINGTPVGNLAANVAVNQFSGNGSTTAFTLTQAPTGTNNIDVYISGVRQDSSRYSVSGTTLTFVTAPPTGTNNIEVKIGGTLSIGTPSDASVTAAKLVDSAVDLTGAKVTGTLTVARGGTGVTASEATVASASTVDLGAQAAPVVNITGTTTITAFGTAAAGVRRTLRFAGALTLTHNGTSLILPGAANVVTVAGDMAEAHSLGSGNWRVDMYARQSGAPLVTPASGALELLAVRTASSSASLDFASVITSAYDVYEIEIVDLRPATDNVTLMLRTSTNNGSSYDATGYHWSRAERQVNTASPTETLTGSTSDTAIRLAAGGVGNASGGGTQESICATLVLRNPLGTASYKYIDGVYRYFDPATATQRGDITGARISNSAVNAFQVLFSGGNITSGVVYLYGKRNA